MKATAPIRLAVALLALAMPAFGGCSTDDGKNGGDGSSEERVAGPRVYLEGECLLFDSEAPGSGLSPADCANAVSPATGSASDIIKIVDVVLDGTEISCDSASVFSLIEVYDESTDKTFCLSVAPGYAETYQ